MEDFSKIGVERYRASSYVQKNDVLMFFTFLWGVGRAVFYLLTGCFSYILDIFTNKRETSFLGRVALVTGAGNGFGRALAIQLAAEGAHIAVVDIDEEAAEETAAAVRSLNVKSFAYKVDVSDCEQVEKLHKDVIKDLGVVDILINNAGILPLMSFREGTPADVERIIKVNLLSHFWTTRVFLPDMINQKRGHIVGISSGFGIYPGGRSVAYTASKYGVRGFMNSLSEELLYDDRDFIKTTTIFPGPIATRQDVTDIYQKLNLCDKLLCMTPRYAALLAVRGIKNGTEVMSMPTGLVYFFTFLSLLPRFIRGKLVFGYIDGKVAQIHPNHC
ncbi:estradiol 17-beta-dehydrogenase 11 [Sergentomyia squamirostris]